MTQGVISLTNRYWLLQVKSLWKREEPIISLKTTTKTCILSVLIWPGRLADNLCPEGERT